MIEAVVFDIGNVLVEWHPERVYDPVVGAVLRDHLFHVVGLDAMNAAVDAGAPFAQSVAELAARHPDHAPHIRLWHDRWSDMFQPEIPQSVRILRALKARGVPVMALSNFGRETFAMAERMYPVLTEFDRSFVSGHLGVIKPDPRIYEIVESRTGLAPEGLFFIDDRADNVAAAAARGWQVHHFTGPGGLATRLVGMGMLSEEEAGP